VFDFAENCVNLKLVRDQSGRARPLTCPCPVEKRAEEDLAMQVKSDISRGLTRTIAEAAESWQADHGDLLAVRDVDYLVREALRVSQFLREWRDDLWQMALANQIDDLHAAGMMLRRAL